MSSLPGMKLPHLSAARSTHLFEDGRCGAALCGSLVVSFGADSGHGPLVALPAGPDAFERVPETDVLKLPQTVTALGAAHKSSLVAVANEAHEVLLYSLPALNIQSTITRATLPVRAIAFSPDDSKIAVGGDSRSVRVVSVANPTHDVFDIHVGLLVKTLAFDPAGEALAVATQDGSVLLYDVRTPAHPLLARVEGVKKGDTSDPQHSSVEYPLAWHATGAVLAVGTDDGVALLSRSAAWARVYALRFPTTLTSAGSVKDAFQGTCALAWSANARYLIAASGQRVVGVWDVVTPATDPMTAAPLRKDADGTSEPALVTCGLLPNAGGDAGGEAAPQSATMTSARVAQVVWPLVGDVAFVLDVTGELTGVRINRLLPDNQLVPVLETQWQWPLRVVVPAAEAARGANVLRKRKAGGSGAAGAGDAYKDADAVDSDASDEVAAPPARDAAGTPAKPTAEEGGRDGGAVASLSALKQKHGFMDADEDDEEGAAGEGAGGLRRMPSAASSSRALEYDEDGLLASERFVTLDMLERHIETAGRYVKEVYGFVAPQAPFHATATTALKRAFSSQVKRYLCWNNVGVVTSIQEASGGRYTIDFTDSNKHRAISDVDLDGWTMAALNDDGIFFACPYTPPAGTGALASDGSPSTLRYRPFAGFGSSTNLSWSLALPMSSALVSSRRIAPRPSCVPDVAAASRSDAGELGGGSRAEDADDSGLDTSELAESALAVALGTGWCAVATDHQCLRFYRSSGVQDMVFALPGAVVTIAGRGALCAVAYHRAAPTHATQHIAIDVYAFHCGVEGATLPMKQATLDLPLRPRTTLQWLGFSDRGLLAAHDSNGSLLITSPALNWAWVVACDTKAAAAAAASAGATDENARAKLRAASRDVYWPVDIVMAPASNDGSGRLSITPPDARVPTLMAVLCKGGVRQPAVVVPKQLTSMIPLRLRVVDAGVGDAAKMDEQYLRHELLRLHTEWLRMHMLTTTGAASLSLTTSLAAATAAARGDRRTDASTLMESEALAAGTAAAEYQTSLDRSNLRAITEAVNAGQEMRAVQLGTRLHLDKSFSIAHSLAAKADALSAAERFAQLAAAKKAAALLQSLLHGASDGGPTAAAAAAALALPAAGLAAATRAQMQAEGVGAVASAASLTDDAAATSGTTRFGLAAATSTGGIPGLSAARPVQRGAGAAGAPPARGGGEQNIATALRSFGTSGASSPTATASVAGAGGRPSPPALPDSYAEPEPVASNPFGRKTFASPQKRPRVGLDALAQDSPERPSTRPLLNRQTSVAQQARDMKRARMHDDLS